MTKNEYNELKKLAEERLLPLADHSLGCYATIEPMIWGDGEECGQECGFAPYLRLGYYLRNPRIYEWDGYAEKKAMLEGLIEEATEARAKVKEKPQKIVGGWETHKPDCECWGDGNNPIANSLRY